MASLVRTAFGLMVSGLVAGCAGTPTRAVAVAEDGKTLVRCAGPAAKVLAIGSFDGWGTGVALAQLPDGTFAAALELSSGPAVVACERHAADGSVATDAPLNADRVVDDGFGGRNGVFDDPSVKRPSLKKGAVTSDSRVRLSKREAR